MKAVNEQLLEQVNYLISDAQGIIGSALTKEVETFDFKAFPGNTNLGYQHGSYPTKKENRLFYDGARIVALETSVKTFMLRLYPDTDHPRNRVFNVTTQSDDLKYLERTIAILESTKVEIEKGWVVSFSELVSAEIFSDSLDAAKHLLDSGYKDAAAVLIGSTLEGHLRELAKRNGIEIVNDKGKLLTGGALNQELTTAKVYDASKNKAVTLYLDTRNDAAHGHYDKYTAPDVQQMYSGVVLFISQT